MTCALLRRPAAESPAPGQLRASWDRLARRLSEDDATAQFARFVTVGGVSSALYGLLFVLLDGLGHQPANLVGAVASSMLANELHRRLTFHAGERVSWFTAQWEGGGLAVAGMVATALALAWFDAVTTDAGTPARLAVVAAVTGAIGLLRFVALRWVFGARSPDRA
ncbi:GtrA family protein [Geodermatophilus sp. SYSU D00815]